MPALRANPGDRAPLVKVSRRFHDVGTERSLPSDAQPMTRSARPIPT